jgi:hypothetical protein
MKYWMYIESAGNTSEPIYTILSEKAIIAHYYPYWQQRMALLGETDFSNLDECIKHFVTTNWAIPVTKEKLLEAFGNE